MFLVTPFATTMEPLAGLAVSKMLLEPAEERYW